MSQRAESRRAGELPAGESAIHKTGRAGPAIHTMNFTRFRIVIYIRRYGLAASFFPRGQNSGSLPPSQKCCELRSRRSLIRLGCGRPYRVIRSDYYRATVLRREPCSLRLMSAALLIASGLRLYYVTFYRRGDECGCVGESSRVISVSTALRNLALLFPRCSFSDNPGFDIHCHRSQRLRRWLPVNGGTFGHTEFGRGGSVTARING